jgi:hypothetical protein
VSFETSSVSVLPVTVKVNVASSSAAGVRLLECVLSGKLSAFATPAHANATAEAIKDLYEAIAPSSSTHRVVRDAVSPFQIVTYRYPIAI